MNLTQKSHDQLTNGVTTLVRLEEEKERQSRRSLVKCSDKTRIFCSTLTNAFADKSMCVWLRMGTAFDAMFIGLTNKPVGWLWTPSSLGARDKSLEAASWNWQKMWRDQETSH